MKIDKPDLIFLPLFLLLCIPLILLSTHNSIGGNFKYYLLFAVLSSSVDLWLLTKTKQFKKESDLIKKVSDFYGRFLQDLLNPLLMLVIGLLLGKLS